MPPKKKTPAAAVEPAIVVAENAISERLQLKRLLSNTANNTETEKPPTVSSTRGRATAKSKREKSSIEANDEEEDSPAETEPAPDSKGGSKRGGRRGAKKTEEVSPVEGKSKNSTVETSSRVMRSRAQSYSKAKRNDPADSDSEESNSAAPRTRRSRQKEKHRNIEVDDEVLSEDLTLHCPDAELKEPPPEDKMEAIVGKRKGNIIRADIEELKSQSPGPSNKVAAADVRGSSPVLLKQQISHPASDVAINDKLSSDSKAFSPSGSNNKISTMPPNPFAGSKAIPSKPPVVNSSASRLWVEDISKTLQKSKTIQCAPMTWRSGVTPTGAAGEDAAIITFAGSFLDFSDAQRRIELQNCHRSVYGAGSDEEDDELLFDPSDHYMDELCRATSIAIGEASTADAPASAQASRYTVLQGDEKNSVQFALSLWGVRTCPYLMTEIDRRKEENRVRLEQDRLRQEQERIEKEKQRLEKERIQQQRKKQAQERREKELEKIRMEKEKERLRLEREKAEELQKKEKEIIEQRKEKERLAAKEQEKERLAKEEEHAKLSKEKEKDKSRAGKDRDKDKDKDKARVEKGQEKVREVDQSAVSAEKPPVSGREKPIDKEGTKSTLLHTKKKEGDSAEKSTHKRTNEVQKIKRSKSTSPSSSESETSTSRLAGKKKLDHKDKTKKSSHKQHQEGIPSKKPKYQDEHYSKSSSSSGVKVAASSSDLKGSRAPEDRKRSRSRSIERHHKDNRNRANWQQDSSRGYDRDRDRDRAGGFRDDRDQHRGSYLNDPHPSDRRPSNAQWHFNGPAERDDYRRSATDGDRRPWPQYDEYRDRDPPPVLDQFGRQDRRYDGQNFSRPDQGRGNRNHNDDRRR